MRKLLRSFFIHFFAVWVIAYNFGGISYGNNLQILAFGALALSVADSLLKPLINLLLLPFNMVTLGLFRWVSSVITLYVATTVVPGLAITSFTYSGFSSNLFIIPPISLGVFGAYIAISFLISTITSFLFWLSK